MRVFAAIVALCAAAVLFLVGKRRWWDSESQRHSDQMTIGVAILILMASTMVTLARPSHDPGITHLVDDRYPVQAHMSTDVLNAIRSKSGAKSRHRDQREYAGGRPAAWCGWWLGQHLGMPLRALWLARNWAAVGSNAGGPGVGVIVVWRHHVGIITGRGDKGWIVKSGNDGGAVRERARSIAGVIAYRTRS